MRKRQLNANIEESESRPFFLRRSSFDNSKTTLVLPPIVPSSPKPENDVELESVGDQDSVFGAVDGDVQPGISMFIMLIY